MKRETLLERKRFAAELAALDDERGVRGLVNHAGRRRLSGGASRAVRGGTDLRPSAEPSIEVEKPEVLPPTDAEILERYRMRRWWLDRYSLDEIRELAECLR